MGTDSYPDPFRDAAQHGLQRALQVASCAGTITQVVIYHLKTQARAVAEQDERARRALQAQIRADKDAARAGWAPALDAEWLRRADLRETAQAWGAAVPYADRSVPWYEPVAATAQRKAEDRLRELHPYAMAHYHRLRADGRTPAEAMREAAPLFASAPRARDAPSQPRLALEASSPAGSVPVADGPMAVADVRDDQPDGQALDIRGSQIVAALQEEALGEAELRTVLETVTNLPADVIDRLARSSGARRRPAGPHRAGARPWQHDFPVSICEVVATAAGQTTPAAQSQATAVRARVQQRPPGSPRP